jgi:hypothetical protein
VQLRKRQVIISEIFIFGVSFKGNARIAYLFTRLNIQNIFINVNII